MDAWEEQIKSPNPMTAPSAMLSKLKSLPGAGTTGSWPSTDPFAGAAVNPMQFWVQMAERWQKAWSDAMGVGGERRRWCRVRQDFRQGFSSRLQADFDRVGTNYKNDRDCLGHLFQRERWLDAAITAGLRRTRSVAMQAADRRNFRPIGGAIHVYGGDFFGAERSEWDPETLEEGRYDAAKTMRLFEEANALYRTAWNGCEARPIIEWRPGMFGWRAIRSRHSGFNP
jgi:hypothetical protein